MAGKAGLVLLGWVIFLALAEAWSGRRAHQRANDRRLLTNVSFTIFIFGTAALFPLARLAASSVGQWLNLGLLRSVHWPWVAILAIAVLADSFANYWTHRIAHQTPLLWRLHRVHHADNEVDLSTSFRNHPLELLIVTLPVSAAVILVLGTSPSVVVATQTLLAAATLWQHADIVLSRRIDRALGWVIVTPRFHRLHHNPERATHDSNFGELLTVWDRLFGTFNRAEGRLSVGLDDQVAAPDRLLQQIWSPVYSA